jgi:hypothetical protein
MMLATSVEARREIVIASQRLPAERYHVHAAISTWRTVVSGGQCASNIAELSDN